MKKPLPFTEVAETIQIFITSQIKIPLSVKGMKMQLSFLVFLHFKETAGFAAGRDFLFSIVMRFTKVHINFLQFLKYFLQTIKTYYNNIQHFKSICKRKNKIL